MRITHITNVFLQKWEIHSHWNPHVNLCVMVTSVWCSLLHSLPTGHISRSPFKGLFWCETRKVKKWQVQINLYLKWILDVIAVPRTSREHWSGIEPLDLELRQRLNAVLAIARCWNGHPKKATVSQYAPPLCDWYWNYSDLCNDTKTNICLLRYSNRRIVITSLDRLVKSNVSNNI